MKSVLITILPHLNFQIQDMALKWGHEKQMSLEAAYNEDTKDTNVIMYGHTAYISATTRVQSIDM